MNGNCIFCWNPNSMQRQHVQRKSLQEKEKDIFFFSFLRLCRFCFMWKFISFGLNRIHLFFRKIEPSHPFLVLNRNLMKKFRRIGKLKRLLGTNANFRIISFRESQNWSNGIKTWSSEKQGRSNNLMDPWLFQNIVASVRASAKVNLHARSLYLRSY